MSPDVEAVAMLDEDQKSLSANDAPKTSGRLHDGEIAVSPRQGSVLRVVAKKEDKPNGKHYRDEAAAHR